VITKQGKKNSLVERFFMRVTFKFLPILTPLLIASSSAIAQQSEWKAGIAKVAITPEQPVWMAGYASRSRPSEGKVHDLYARALALQDKRGSRVVIKVHELTRQAGRKAKHE
jgi:hypothetical protein